MGSKYNNIWNLIICMIFVHHFIMLNLMMMMMISPSFVHGEDNITHNPDSLDSSIRDNALRMLTTREDKFKTGVLYNLTLPNDANYSGVKATAIRLRSGSLWRYGGGNLSSFEIPPRIRPHPYSERVILVFQDLGNQSAVYYSVPNHTLVAPVLGLSAYDANFSLNDPGSQVELIPLKDPVLVHFPQLDGTRYNGSTAKCVKFSGMNGEVVEFSNVTMDNKCVANGQGHFSIAIPSLPLPPSSPPGRKVEKKVNNRYWRWWVIGFGVGICCLIISVVFGIVLYKFIRVRKIGKMERQSEKGEALDTIWIGSSRMPSASGIRTQPVLENSYLP
ncbi:OLC1v1038450C1 [Oldenlandia corymbosa var. corymbosa]|uniref:OLC1v1038450C1 n=1 Tax=Oldenlandia corymbosa var. corymbosa TaxID=529605 RepID=A0AAV1D2Y8_OLDCO|nr:OLC1v1038450C1 [Oldenlandia corymbosa var. corymbosa]